MTSDPMPRGRRRIDRVLAEGFLDRLADAPLEDVRAKRKDAEQEEADLSYVRRLLQGRADLIKAEMERRRGGGHVAEGGDQELVRRLTAVLADPRGTSHGMGRFITVEPSRVDEHRRAVEQLIADVGISDITHLSEDDLRAALARVEDFERNVSGNRRRVQQVMDACTAEIGRRYRDGEARVGDVLPDR